MLVLVVVNAPGYLRQAWESLILQIDSIGFGAHIGSVADVVNGAVGVVMLVLPVLGLPLTYLMLCRGLGVWLAVRRARVDLTLSNARDNAVSAGYQR